MSSSINGSSGGEYDVYSPLTTDGHRLTQAQHTLINLSRVELPLLLLEMKEIGMTLCRIVYFCFRTPMSRSTWILTSDNSRLQSTSIFSSCFLPRTTANARQGRASTKEIPRTRTGAPEPLAQQSPSPKRVSYPCRKVIRPSMSRRSLRFQSNGERKNTCATRMRKHK